MDRHSNRHTVISSNNPHEDGRAAIHRAVRQTTRTMVTPIGPLENLERRLLMASDLKADSLTASGPVKPGQELTLSWSVLNKGPDVVTEYSWDSIVYSVDDVFGNDDDLHMSDVGRPDQEPVDSGKGYSVKNKTFVLPRYAMPGQAGHLLLHVDTHEGVEDPDRTNNVIAIPYTPAVTGVNLTARPIDGQTPPATIQLGAHATTKYAVKNTGTVASTDGIVWSDGVYLSSDNKLDKTDLLVGSDSGTYTQLAPGGEYEASVSIDMPVWAPTGPKFLLLATDLGGYEPEDNADDSYFAVPVTVTVPDVNLQVGGLAVSDIDGTPLGSTPHLSPYTSYTANFDVYNRGSEDVTAYTYDSVYYSTDAFFDPDKDAWLGYAGQTDMPAAGAGYEQTVGLSFDTSDVPAGDGYLIAVADHHRYWRHGEINTAQPETNESDNWQAVAIFVNAYDVDLTLTDVTAPAGGAFGAEIPVTWQGENKGSTVPRTFHDAVYLSDDDTLDWQDERLAYVEIDPTKVVNGKWTGSATVKLPGGNLDPAHQYRLIVVTNVDYYEAPETGETTNQISTPIGITYPQVDLEVTEVIPEAPAAQPGEYHYVQWKVKNNGPLATTVTQWQDDVFYCPNGQIDDDAVRLTTVTHKGRLEADEVYTGAAYVRLDADLPLGQGTLVVRVNVTNFDGGQPEQDTTNNVGSAPLRLMHANTAVTDVSTDTPDVEVGKEITVSWRIDNTSDVHTVGSWYDRVYLSKDNKFDDGDESIISKRHQAWVYAKDGYNESVTFDFPAYTKLGAGAAYVIVQSPGDAHDTNAADNEKATPVTLVGPNLSVRNFTIDPPSGDSGDSFTVEYDVYNTGNSVARRPDYGWTDRIYSSADDGLDRYYDKSVGYVNDIATPDLAPGEHYSVKKTVTLSGSGPLYVIVSVDDEVQWGRWGGYVNEAGEGDNVFAHRVPLNAPDLQVTAATGPDNDTAAAGTFVGVSYTVSNLGTASANEDWYDSIYLLKDGDPSYGATRLDALSAAEYSPLATTEPNKSYTVTRQVRIPANVSPGAYHIEFVTDQLSNQYPENYYNNRQPELDNENNARSIPVTIVTPDLVVDAVTVDKTQSPSNGKMHLTWTVRNAATNGAAALTRWSDTVYVSADAELSNDDTPIKSFEQWAHEGLAAGDSYTAEGDVTLPSLKSDTYHLIVVADQYWSSYGYADRSSVGESDETNNWRDSGAIAVKAPDLIVGGIEAPDTAILNGSLLVKYVVKNDSDNPAVASWLDGVYISDDNKLDFGDRTLRTVESNHNGSLAGRGTYDRTVEVTIPGNVSSGLKYLIVRADVPLSEYHPEGQQGEDNENNNWLAIPLNVVTTDLVPSAPSLTVGGPDPVDGEASVGQPISVGWTVKNDGTTAAPGKWVDHVYLSRTGAYDRYDSVFVGQYDAKPHSGLPSKDTYRGTLDAVLPGVAPGEWHLIVLVDAKGGQSETNEDNNILDLGTVLVKPADLVVRKVKLTPNPVQTGDAVTVSYEVLNQGAGVAFGRSGRWYDNVTIKNADGQTVASQIVEHTSAEGPLVGGAARPRSVSLTLPRGSEAAGELTVTVAADQGSSGYGYGDVGEYDPDGNAAENNNEATVKLTSVLGAFPDLTIDAKGVTMTSATGSPPAAGQAAVVRWVMKNEGTGDATGTWTNRVRVINLTTGEEIISQLVPFTGSATKNGGTAAAEYQFQLPHGPRGTGPMRVVIDADAGHDVYEGRTGVDAEANNQGQAEITALASPYPDLTVKSVTAPVEARNGSGMILNWTLENGGTADANGPWTDSVYLSADDHIGGHDDQLIASYTFNGTVKKDHGTVDRTQTVKLPANLTPGSYYFYVVTDSGHVVLDFPSDNNRTIAKTATQVKAKQRPNLIVTQVQSPGVAYSGQKAVIKWDVQNTGDAATANTWQDAVYLSSDRAYQGTDILLGRLDNVAALNAAGVTDGSDKYSASMEVTLPRGIDGSWHFIVKTDAGNNVEEQSDGDNDGASLETKVTLTPPPDLRIDNAKFSSSILFSGQTLLAEWTVKNYGPGATPNGQWYDSVYFSTDDKLDNADKSLTNVRHDGVLDASGDANHYVASGQITLPKDHVGRGFLIFLTDTNNAVNESAFEDNNVKAVEVNVIPTPPPDLVVSGLSLTGTLLSGRTAKLSYAVKNDGLTPVTENGWVDRFYLSPDNVLDLDVGGNPTNGDALVTVVRTPGGQLKAGGSIKTDLDVLLPAKLQAGPHFLFAQTDAYGTTTEADEGNNEKVVPVNLGTDRPDLTVSKVQAESSVVAGAKLTIKADFFNGGVGDTYVRENHFARIVLRGTGTNGQTYHLATAAAPQVNAGQTVTQQFNVTVPASVVSGDYELFVEADDGNYQPESNEDNNSSAATPVAVRRLVPDLVVRSISAAGSVRADKALIVRWVVANDGDGGVETNLYDGVYLTHDGKLDGSEIRLKPGPVMHEAPGIKGSVPVERSFSLPPDAVGNYTLVVRTDEGGSVAESDETNNTAGRQITVLPYEAPDLTVPQVTAPGSAYTGRQVRIEWTVRNTGGPLENLADGTPQGWTDTVYLSQDGTYDEGVDRAIGSLAHTGTLAKDGTYTASALFTIPADLVADDYHVFVRSDSGNTVYEGSTPAANNFGQSAVMRVTATPPADLVAQDFTVPTNGLSGREMSVTYTVKNEGANPALGGWFDTLYLSSDDNWDSGDVLIGRVRHDGDIAADGGSYTHTLTADVPGVTPGDYKVIVRSDILNHVPEANEANNIKASVDKITLDADVLPLAGSTEGELKEAKAVYYKVAVGAADAGRALKILLDAAAAKGANELYVAYGRMPSRVDFDARNVEAAEADVSATVSRAKAGTYYVLAYGQSLSDGQAALPKTTYTLAAGTISFGVTSVGSTSTVLNTGKATLRLNGAMFDGSTTFSVVGPDGNVINGQRTSLRSAALAFSTFDFAGAPAGPYAVRATHVVGGQSVSATLANAFTVTGSLPDGGREGYAINLAAPGSVRGRFPMTVSWGNDTSRDLPAPLILISSDLPLPISLDAGAVQGGDGRGELLFLGASPNGYAGTLQAGEQHTAAIYSGTKPGSRTTYKTFIVPVSDTRPMNYEYAKGVLPVTLLTAPDFASLWTKMKTAIGPTWGNFAEMMGNLADTMPASYGDNRDPSDLLGYLARRVRAESGRGLFGRATSDDAELNLSDRRVTATNADTGDVFVTTTLRDGSFVFEDVTAGKYAFAFDDALVVSQSQVQADGNGPTTGATAVLTAGATWTGRVRNAAGRGVAGATIVVTHQNGTKTNVVTDETGRYAFEGLIAGTYDLSVEADGYARSRTDAVAVTTADVSANVTLAAEATLTGTFASTPATGTSTFTVTVNRLGVGNGLDGDVYTLRGTGGAFGLGGLPAGTYDVTISRKGFVPAMQTVTVTAGQTLALAPANLSVGASLGGTVSGTPASAKPRVGVFDSAGKLVASLFADDKGKFAFYDLAAGTYTLKLTGGSAFATTQTVTLAGGAVVDDVVLTALPGGTVRGTATDAGGAAIGDLTVVLVDAAGNRRRTVTGDDGRYAFDALAAGAYAVVVPGSGARSTVTVENQNGDARTVDLSLASAADVSGFVLTAGGAAVAGANVMLYSGDRLVAQATADANGKYAFSVFAAGTYAVRASSAAASFDAAAPLTVAAGDRVTQTLRSGTGRLNVAVQGLSGKATVLLYRNDPTLGSMVAGRIELNGGNVANFANLAAGNYTASFIAADGTVGLVKADVAGGQTATADVSPTSVHTVAGLVEDASGRVNNATVLLLDAATHAMVGYATTDKNGGWSVDGQRDGTYDVVVVAAGHQAKVVTVTVSGSDTVAPAVTLAAGGATLIGRVVDQNGAAVGSGARVTILDAQGRAIGWATAGADGTFTIGGVTGGKTVCVTTPGGGTVESPLASAVTANASAGDVVAGVYAVGRVSPKAAATGRGGPKTGGVKAAKDEEFEFPSPELPSFPDGWLNDLYNTYSYDAEHIKQEAHIADMLDLPEDAPMNVRRLWVKAIQNIELQFDRFEIYDMQHERRDTNANWSIAMLTTEFAATAGAVAGLVLAFETVGAALVGVESVAGGAIATTYSLAQIGANVKALYDIFYGMLESQDVPTLFDKFKQFADLATNEVGSMTGAFDNMVKALKFEQWGGVTGPARGSAVAGGLANILSFAASYKSFIETANFNETSKILEEIKQIKVEEFGAFRDYVLQCFKAKKAVDEYNDAVRNWKKKQDDTRDGDTGPGKTPGSPGGSPDDSDPVDFPLSQDPNDILGPVGHGAANWTAAVGRPGFGYTIRFENDKSAQAPAQQITVTQQLDADLDWKSFRVNGFAFGSTVIELPGDRGQFVQRIDMRSTLGVYVDAAGTIDLNTGKVTFVLTAIDPATGQRPADPTKGLLPPNDATGRGEGFFRYTIKAKQIVASGTAVDARATIVFDENAAIDTPAIVNTLDTIAPTSSVQPVANTGGSTFAVKWGGQDAGDAGASGVAGYDIYVATDNGAYVLWLANTVATEATYAGEAGHTYGFYSVATDVAGNQEEAPTTADAVATGGDNAVPVVTLAAVTVTGDAGGLTRLAGSAVDRDLGDVLAARVDFGDGTGWQDVPLKADGGFDLAHAYAAAGTYTLTVQARDGKNAVGSATAAVTVNGPAPVVSGMTVGDGSAQRSMVSGLTVSFDQAVTLSLGAVTLWRRDGGNPPAAVACTVLNPSGDGKTWVVAGFGGNSLADGIYDVKIVASRVHAAAGGRAMTADALLTTHRLFGDANGDKAVDRLDENVLRAAYGTSAGQANFNAAFDYDGNGVIDRLDQNAMRPRYGIVYAY